MNPTDVMTGLPAGFYILTGNGELGCYDAQRKLHIDAALSRAFSDHNRAFLRAYLGAAQPGEFRSAILFETLEPREWGRLTLSLEDFVVRDLYFSGGRPDALTGFQRKNREKSTYRGMELLLESRRESAPETPIYCPVLFDPHTTLAQRVSALGREPEAQERAIPVVDVLNLIATLPSARRATPEVLALLDKLRQGIIRKDQRRDRPWEVHNGSRPVRAAVQAHADSPRGLSLRSLDQRRLHENEHVETVERWLKIPQQPVAGERLHAFAQFRGFDDQQVAELSARSLIYAAPGGTRLLERGLNDSWNLYLLEGTLALTPADGAALKVVGGTDKAAHPITSLKPRKYQVDTVTPVTFLWVHDLLLKAIAEETAASS